MVRLGESVARRRVFWFLVALVVGPTIGLAVYGMLGVMDRQAASQARLRDRYEVQAQALEVGIFHRIEEEDSRVRAALSGVAPEALPAAVAALARPDTLVSEAWTLEDPALPAAVQSAAQEATLSVVTPLSFVSSGDDGSAIAISRVDAGLTVAYRIDPRVVDALVLPRIAAAQFPGERAIFRLEVRDREPEGTPLSLERIRQDLTARAGEPEAILTRSLAAPLDHWRIVARTPEADLPQSTAAGWWVVAMALTVVIGVILLGRAIAQQAALSRLQTDFVSNVSHEMRTPLTSIRMFVETLQSGRVKDPEKVKECLDIIALESERLSRRIERVLSWARMEAGRRIYEFELRRPVEIAQLAVEHFRGQWMQEAVAVVIDVPSHLPLVRVDVEAFGDALVNLLNNARKYGGPEVHIWLEGRQEGTYVSFTVADDGPGIPATERKRIFDKFYRPNVLQSRSVQGSGLGLAIVRAVVQAHKGRIEVESEEGRGARFSIRVPAA